MSKLSSGSLGGKLLSRQIRRWGRKAETCDANALREMVSQTANLHSEIGDFLAQSKHRLRLKEARNFPTSVPSTATWTWRPDLWTGQLSLGTGEPQGAKITLSQDVTLFHDCPLAEFHYRQFRTDRTNDTAPTGLEFGVFEFDGTFLSLAIDVPDAGCSGLNRNHIVQVDLSLDLEAPIEVFARLNVQHGPNIEQLVQELNGIQSEAKFEYDLAYSNLREKEVERAWLDLIFEKPRMNQVTLRDVIFSKRPRTPL